jgi:hypothetical protein
MRARAHNDGGLAWWRISTIETRECGREQAAPVTKGMKRPQPRMNPMVTKEAGLAVARITACRGGSPTSDNRDRTGWALPSDGGGERPPR